MKRAVHYHPSTTTITYPGPADRGILLSYYESKEDCPTPLSPPPPSQRQILDQWPNMARNNLVWQGMRAAFSYLLHDQSRPFHKCLICSSFADPASNSQSYWQLIRDGLLRRNCERWGDCISIGQYRCDQKPRHNCGSRHSLGVGDDSHSLEIHRKMEHQGSVQIGWLDYTRRIRMFEKRISDETRIPDIVAATVLGFVFCYIFWYDFSPLSPPAAKCLTDDCRNKIWARTTLGGYNAREKRATLPSETISVETMKIPDS